MFFPRDINQIILQNDGLGNLANSITTEKTPNSKKVFFLVFYFYNSYLDSSW